MTLNRVPKRSLSLVCSHSGTSKVYIRGMLSESSADPLLLISCFITIPQSTYDLVCHTVCDLVPSIFVSFGEGELALNCAAAPQGDQVLHEKNDSEMSQSFYHVEYNVLVLIDREKQ